jgi:hypothetical protein
MFVTPYAESLDGEDALTRMPEPPVNMTKLNRQAFGHLARAYGAAMLLLRRYRERKPLSRHYCCKKDRVLTGRDWHRGIEMLKASGVMVKTVGHRGGYYFPLEYKYSEVRLDEFRKQVVVLLNANQEVSFLTQQPALPKSDAE